MLARRRVLDAAIARQLVGLLPVLAPALAIALAGEAAVPGTGPAGQAGEVSVISTSTSSSRVWIV